MDGFLDMHTNKPASERDSLDLSYLDYSVSRLKFDGNFSNLDRDSAKGSKRSSSRPILKRPSNQVDPNLANLDSF